MCLEIDFYVIHFIWHSIAYYSVLVTWQMILDIGVDFRWLPEYHSAEWSMDMLIGVEVFKHDVNTSRPYKVLYSVLTLLLYSKGRNRCRVSAINDTLSRS
jgi:hypothetical protein